jgi:transcriptional regulator with XRE-family HTH domain
MSRITHKQVKNELLDNQEVAESYEAMAEQFELLREMIQARQMRGLTQEEVAELMETTKSAVSRLESARAKHSPSIATLQKYAHALGYKLSIHFEPENQNSKKEA